MSSFVRRFALPVAWAVCGLLVLASSILMAPASDTALKDTYYAVADLHYVATIVGVFLLFAVWYAVFEWLLGVPCQARLGWTSLVLMTVGVVLMLVVPTIIAAQNPERTFHEMQLQMQASRMWSNAGYCLALAGLGVSLLAIVEAVMRRKRASKDGLSGR